MSIAENASDGRFDPLGNNLIRTEQYVQNNTGFVAGVVQNIRLIVRGLIDNHDLSDDYVRALARTFVEPEGFERARDLLQQHRVVILEGGANSGLHHAAVCLLDSCANGRELREVDREPDEPVDVAALQVEGKAAAWLLDLRRDTNISPTLGRKILAERNGLLAADSFLVVIGVRGDWLSGANEILQSIGPVNPIEIVRRRLGANSIGIDPESYLADSRVNSGLATSSPAEAVAWADAIIKVDSIELPQVDDASQPITADRAIYLRRDMLVQMRSSWRKDLAIWHRGNDSRARNFLLAAAVLEGQPAGDVFEAALQAAVELGEHRPESAGQQGPGIIQLADTVGAELDETERLYFTKPGFAAAAIDYFWVDRQHLREKFLEWLSKLPLTQSEPTVVASRAADYVLRSAVRQGSIKDLRQVVVRWSRRPELHDAAADLILAATLEGGLARSMTEQTLSWARGNDVAIQLVLAKVCSGEYARLRPAAALLRLASLAESDDGSVVDAVTKSIAELWNIEQLRNQILLNVQQWSDPASIATRRRAGASAFLALASYAAADDGGSALLADAAASDTHRRLAGRGWGAVLDVAVPDSVFEASARRVLATWLDDALGSEGLQRVLIDVLIAAVQSEDQAMHGAARRATHLARLLYDHPPVSQTNKTADARTQLKNWIHFRAVDSLSRHAAQALGPVALVPRLSSGENVDDDCDSQSSLGAMRRAEP